MDLIVPNQLILLYLIGSNTEKKHHAVCAHRAQQVSTWPFFIARYELFQELGPNAVLTDEMVLLRVEQNKLLDKENDQHLNKKKRAREPTTSNRNVKRARTEMYTPDSSLVNFTLSNSEEEEMKRKKVFKKDSGKRNNCGNTNSGEPLPTVNPISSNVARGGQRHVVQPGSVMSCTLLGPHKIRISVKKAINV